MGQLIAVNFGAFVECDHDDGIGVGAGGAAGLVQGLVKWVVVERFVV